MAAGQLDRGRGSSEPHLGWRCVQIVSTVKAMKQMSWMASPASVMPHPSRI